MAKDLEPDDAPFEIPKFDEDDFVRKELLSFRTTIILFFYSLLVAGITYFIWRETGMRFFFLLVFAIAAVGALPFIYRLLKIDVSHWKRGQWIGTTFLHFFFWMGFTLLLTNPPIADNAPPLIDMAVSPPYQVPGEAVLFGAYMADNNGLREETLQFCLVPVPSGATPAARYADVDPQACRPYETLRAQAPFWQFSYTSETAGDYAFYVRIEDRTGRPAEVSGQVHFGDPFRSIEPPRSDTFAHSDDSMKVCPRLPKAVETSGDQTHVRFAPVRVVQFSLDGTTYRNFVVHPDPDSQDCWQTKARYQGWDRGNVSVRIRAELQPVYLQTGFQIPPVTVADPDGPYRIRVDHRLDAVGQDAAADIAQAKPQPRVQTPGLEAAGLLAAVGLGLAWAARRARRHA